MSKISIEMLRELIRYNPTTGIVTWGDKHILGRASSTKEAGSISREGSYSYKRIMINGRSYRLHHAIWAYCFGEWPDQIDHINRNALDNRLCNLRLATAVVNSRNRGMFKNNTSGVKGVNFNKSLQRWVARISVDSKPVHLGIFKEKEDAVIARKKAEIVHKYNAS